MTGKECSSPVNSCGASRGVSDTLAGEGCGVGEGAADTGVVPAGKGDTVRAAVVVAVEVGAGGGDDVTGGEGGDTGVQPKLMLTASFAPAGINQTALPLKTAPAKPP